MGCLVFLNDNIVSYRRQRGVARYFRHISQAVIEHFGSETTICSPEVRPYGAAKHIKSVRFPGSTRLRAHDIVASVGSFREQPRVFFSPYYGAARTKAAEVFTIHDMIYELYPQYFDAQDKLLRRFMHERKSCIERATTLLAISTNTAKDIMACYPHIDSSKIVVAHLGVEDSFFRERSNQIRPLNTLNKPFLLYVGNRKLYKNFERLLIAFGESGLAREIDLQVISPGTRGFTKAECEYIDLYGLRDSVHLRASVSDEMLCASYANAIAFVYPSEYEGFGLPVLEALATGTIVATSNTASLPEVGGEVAYYFDPSNINSIVACLQHITALSEHERKQRCIDGIAWARTFTWARCQSRTIDVIRKLI